VGLNWTCVLSNNLGVAMYKIGWGIKDAGRLDEMTTGELAELLNSSYGNLREVIRESRY